jgi:hypothetical protein
MPLTARALAGLAARVTSNHLCLLRLRDQVLFFRLPRRSKMTAILSQASDVDAASENEPYRFNDDLLITKKDRQQAQKMFPAVFHILDYPELRAVFAKFDSLANAAKVKSRRFGLTAIGLAVFALLVTSAEPLYRDLPYDLPQAISFAAATAGIVAVIIGFFGIRFAKQKRDWLEKRLMTERLRQFHFQTMVAKWPDIVQSFGSEKAREEYMAKRKKWFDAFEARFINHLPSELTDVLEDDSEKDCWLHDMPKSFPSDESAAGVEMFDAYRKFRILDQIEFANIKLSEGQELGFWSLRTQARAFSYIALLCILGVFSIHIWIAGGAAIPAGHTGHWIHIAAIWLAIGALAVRALEEGLQPEREIERYRHYSAAVKAVRDRFNEASSPQQKLGIMKEMERVSFDEMKIFLRSNNEARFVL